MRTEHEKLLTFDPSCRYEVLPRRERKDKRVCRSGVENKKREHNETLLIALWGNEVAAAAKIIGDKRKIKIEIGNK